MWPCPVRSHSRSVCFRETALFSDWQNVLLTCCSCPSSLGCSSSANNKPQQHLNNTIILLIGHKLLHGGTHIHSNIFLPISTSFRQEMPHCLFSTYWIFYLQILVFPLSALFTPSSQFCISILTGGPLPPDMDSSLWSSSEPKNLKSVFMIFLTTTLTLSGGYSWK